MIVRQPWHSYRVSANEYKYLWTEHQETFTDEVLNNIDSLHPNYFSIPKYLNSSSSDRSVSFELHYIIPVDKKKLFNFITNSRYMHIVYECK